MTSKSIPEPSSSSLRNSNSDNEETNQIPSKKHRPLAQDIKKQWNIIKLYDRIIDDTLAVKFAEELGLLPTKQICIIHNSPMKLYTTQIPIGIFQCTKRVCKHKLKTRATGTLFEKTHLTVPRIFYLMYCFGRKYSYEVVQLEDFTSTQCLSTKTIAEWYGYFREMVIDHFLYNDEEVDKVGGPGRIVQIDISKFGSRSYTRSKINRVVDNWVLGIIEEESEDFKLKVCTETIQNADVLIPFIQKHVHLGSTIVTDYSEIYDCISEHGFVHKKVKHCDPNNQSDVEEGTRSHNTRIESQWGAVKGAFYKDNNNRKDSNSQSFADWIVEYQWRRNLRKKFEDPFEQLVKAVLYAFGDFRNT